MLITIQVAARFRKCHRRTLLRAIADGRLKAEKYSHIWLVDQDDAMALEMLKRGRPRKKSLGNH